MTFRTFYINPEQLIIQMPNITYYMQQNTENITFSYFQQCINCLKSMTNIISKALKSHQQSNLCCSCETYFQ